ncbi:MAG: FAD-dependent oxidoreductase [Eggerthellaceae bacterium]|nr:FAD-dependent oxidoreductase [Eggerthellaceae bacterium]
MSDFDVIVIGAGIAGSAAAYKLASEGADVLLVDRADPGSKNLSGGILYGRTLHDLIPDFADQAPVERLISRNDIMMLRENDALTIAYDNVGFAGGEGAPPNGCSVLRAKLDPWLAEQAEEAGASLVTDILVDRLLMEGDRCTGVVAGDDEMTADCVIVADGINSKMAEALGARKGFDIHDMGVGVKYLYRLDEQTVSERFCCREGEGVAYGVMGACTEGIPGGGFLYTNRDSVSVGLVVHIDHLAESGKTPYDLLDAMVANPAVARLLEGGTLVEYGAHMVAEGGARNVPKALSGPGWMIVGDAAGFAANNGFTVRGMDFAAASGVLAAECALAAKQAGDFSAASLSAYDKAVAASFVGRDMETYGGAPSFMKDGRVYSNLVDLACGLFECVYRQDGTPKRNMLAYAKDAVKGADLGLIETGRIAWKAVKSL